MADDTQLGAPSGTGDVISTDDLGTKKVQRVKVQYGVDGSATDASTTSPLPVDQPNTTVADGGALPSKGVQVGGTDGSVFQVLSTDNAGRLNTNVNGTVAVSAASLPLPAGASTSAKQPTLGTAGTASADVISVQGVASMTPVKVDGSGVTQPVSGTVTANLGTAAVTNAGTFAVQIAANSSVNQAQIAGTATSVNSGAKDAGTQRVILASDQTVVPVSDNSGSLTVDAPVGTPVFTTVTPSATGGWSKIKYAAQTTTVQTVKGTAGTFGGYYIFNGSAATAYLQVFDVATATTVTLGTTAPDMIFGIPAGAGANLEVTNGVNMTLGIKLACTTTATGSSAPATGLDLTILFK